MDKTEFVMSPAVASGSLQMFWDAQAQRGDKPCCVYTLTTCEGHKRPVGHVLYWSTSRRAVERWADRVSNQGPTVIEKVNPCKGAK